MERDDEVGDAQWLHDHQNDSTTHGISSSILLVRLVRANVEVDDVAVSAAEGQRG